MDSAELKELLKGATAFALLSDNELEQLGNRFKLVHFALGQISPDAHVDKESGSLYKVLIVPKQNVIAAKGKNVPLRPGLALTAEIVTERISCRSPLRRAKVRLPCWTAPSSSLPPTLAP